MRRGALFFRIHDFLYFLSSVNLENNQIKFRIHFPKLVTRGMYSLNGRILMLPIIGNGLKEGNYSKLRGVSKARTSIPAERFTVANNFYSERRR